MDFLPIYFDFRDNRLGNPGGGRKKLTDEEREARAAAKQEAKEAKKRAREQATERKALEKRRKKDLSRQMQRAEYPRDDLGDELDSESDSEMEETEKEAVSVTFVQREEDSPRTNAWPDPGRNTEIAEWGDRLTELGD